MGIVWGVSKTLVLMFLVMFTFKLAGVVTFGWWVVTAPLWVVPALMTLMILFFYTYGAFSKKRPE